MKRLLILFAVFGIAGCSSFGKGMMEAILDKGEEKDTRQCEIRGGNIPGIDSYFAKGNTVKVMMIHGVGTHEPGYSTRIQENLAKDLNLTVFSKRFKDITLLNPDDGETVIGNLRVSRMQNEDKTKNLLFFELTWSDITTPQKNILAYDYSGQYDYKRAAFNNTTKRFINDTVPDPMIYLIDRNGLILNSAKQATCWMLSSKWENLDYRQKKICRVSSFNQIRDLNRENIVYITHSLGSRILIDSVSDIVNEVGREDLRRNKEARLIIDEMRTKNMTVYMLANQLPMLQIGRKKPAVHNQYDSYCTPKGKKHGERVFNRVNVVAFNDPNDLLSYDITQEFVDEYIDSRMCPAVTNVNINVAKEISAFGVGVVNPITAHTEYDNDERIIEMISHGTKDIKNNPALATRCSFIRLED